MCRFFYTTITASAARTIDSTTYVLIVKAAGVGVCARTADSNGKEMYDSTIDSTIEG